MPNCSCGDLTTTWTQPNFPAAPNQHRPLSDLQQEPDNTAPSLFSLSCFHIHSKTACRKFESYCPCNPLVPRPCENRMAWGFFVPMLARTRSIKSRLMLRPLLSSRIRPQPGFTAVFLSSTQNAPGFALLRGGLGASGCFSGSNFLGRNLCFLPSVVGSQPML